MRQYYVDFSVFAIPPELSNFVMFPSSLLVTILPGCHQCNVLRMPYDYIQTYKHTVSLAGIITDLAGVPGTKPTLVLLAWGSIKVASALSFPVSAWMRHALSALDKSSSTVLKGRVTEGYQSLTILSRHYINILNVN